MRVMMKAILNTEMANRALKEGKLGKLIEATIEMIEPESAYFVAEEGDRCALFVFDLDDSARLPTITEPLFTQLGARISIAPTMNLEDLRTGLGRLASTR